MNPALSRAVLLAALLAPLALAGCNTIPTIDPYQREGIWKPTGVNDANLAAQVANPADLARGRTDGHGTVRTATTAVDRLWSGASQRPQGGGQGGAQAAAGGARPEAPR